MAPQKDYSEIIEQCDSEIRSGQIDRAISTLQRIVPGEVEPRFRQLLASLCRRTGLVHLGLKILTPKDLVDRRHWLGTVTVAEAAEYGVLIQKVGSVREATGILSALDPTHCPDVHLFLAFCHLARWESDQAVVCLEHYAESPLTEYKRLLARVNLASALSGTSQLPRAQKLIEEVLNDVGDNLRLRANCLEIAARVAIDSEDYSRAQNYLSQASQLLQSQGTTDRFLIDKALAIVAARKSKSIEALDDISVRAKARRDWESARDIDFQKLKIRFKRSDFEFLYNGTPFPAYRNRICRDLGVVGPTTGLSLGESGGSRVDLASGRVNGRVEFREGGKVHQTLVAIFRDFYRPVTVGDLFASLYPDEYFDVFSSPERVYQSIRLSRKFLETAGLPIEIHQHEGSYSFRLSGPARVDLPLLDDRPDWNQLQWIKAALIPGQFYSAKELRSRLGLGLSPFWKFANWAVESGRLERSGRGAGTKYRCSPKGLKASA